jgi:hypothetical protein
LNLSTRVRKSDVVAIRETREECEALKAAALAAWGRHEADREPIFQVLKSANDMLRELDKARDAELAAILKGGAT